MLEPKYVFDRGVNLSAEEVAALRAAGMSGALRLDDFHVDFMSIDGSSFRVELTSAAVWLVIQTPDKDYVVFVEQNDRFLPDGSHPWEVPSGKVDFQQDINILHTAAREVKEETGYEITKALAIAIAAKSDHAELSDVEIIPTTRHAIGIGDEDKLKALAEQGVVKGGLIYTAGIRLDLFEEIALRRNCQRQGNVLIHLPPAGVDPSEISRIALEPLEDVLEGRSQFVDKSSHMWAQAVALRAFILMVTGGGES